MNTATAFATLIQTAERALPTIAPTPDIFEPVRVSQPADSGVVRELTAKVLRAGAEGSLRLAHLIAPERDAA